MNALSNKTKNTIQHFIMFQRNIIRYRNFLTKTVRKEVVFKELKVIKQ